MFVITPSKAKIPVDQWTELSNIGFSVCALLFVELLSNGLMSTSEVPKVVVLCGGLADIPNQDRPPGLPIDVSVVDVMIGCLKEAE